VYFGALYSGLGGDEGKWNWMVRICNDNYEKYKQMGMEEDNWKENSVFSEAEYQNATNGYMEDKWFESTLAKLMFFGEPTNTEDAQHQFSQNYAQEINGRLDDDGDTWKSHIPDNGFYDLKVFIPSYFSLFGLVKLYKVDYTVLDSSFSIQNAEVFDNGYATCKVKNTGKKELEITNVNINNIEYDFITGRGNTLAEGEEELIWVDLDSGGTTFQKDDVVNFNITVKSEAFAGNDFIFNNVTENFFVKEPEAGSIKINYKNSQIIQVDNNNIEAILEVENIGENVVLLDRFYFNNDSIENRFNEDYIEYLSGTSILEPGEKSRIYLSNSTFNFYPIGTNNKIGVVARNDLYDEVLFSSNLANYSLSLLGDERIVSPEVLAFFNSNYRNHIPIDFNNTHAFTYEDNTTIIEIKVKNTGDSTIGLKSIYLTESLTEVQYEDYYIKSGNINLDRNEEDVIVVNATGYISGEINEEILVCVTGSFGNNGTIVASNIGYIHTIREKPDIQIIENIGGINTSFVFTDEKAELLLKNTGDESITIDNVYINNTLISNIEYTYGSPSLNIQECAILTFDIPGIKINKSDEVFINITTTSTAQVTSTLKGFVDSANYNITIDDGGTSSVLAGNLTILVTNEGLLNVTIDSVYINNTFISLNGFYPQSFNISVGNSLELTIDMTKISGFSVDDIIEILVRTEEGAEYIHVEIIT